jgi:hypothetical protein
MSKEIFEKYQYLKSEMPHKRKYYHLKSIKNFIDHLNEFVSISDKKVAEELLSNYLEFVIHKEKINQGEAKKIFVNHILPIGKLYSYHLNFSFILQFSSVVFFGLLLVFLLFLFGTPYMILFFLVLLILIYLINRYRKLKSGRVYGYDF